MSQTLERNEPHVLFFRASLDLGKATERYLDDLRSALLAEETPLLEFLGNRSQLWLDNHVEQLASLDYARHVTYVQGQIRAESMHAPDARAEVCKNIAAAIVPTPPDDLARFLHDKNERAHSMAGQAIHGLGGESARQLWGSCACATLKFEPYDDITRCSFARRDGHSIITIHIGNHLDTARHPRKGALRTHFCMLFNLFHEYISHSFSLWQKREFAEGYLFWAERQMFPRLAGDIVHHAFVDATFATHDSSVLEEIHIVATWISHVTHKDSFLRFLIAWAAEVPTNDFDAELDALRYFTKLQPDTGSVVELCTILEQPNHAKARASIRDLGRRVGNLPANYTTTL